MRLLIVNTNGSALGKDGISNVILNLYRGLDHETVDADLVVTKAPDEKYLTEFHGNHDEIICIPRRSRHPVAYAVKLMQIIRNGQYSLIHVHGSSSTMAIELFLAWLAGCKVRIAHGHNTDCRHRVIHTLLKPLLQALCTHRLACSEAAGKWLYGGRDCEVIRNGIDTGRFAFCEKDRSCIRGELGIQQEDILIGHIGMFNDVKNQGFLLEVLKQLPVNYKLAMVGSGGSMKTIKEKTLAMGLTERVFFAGTVANPESYYSAFDIKVLPSLYEGLPLVLMEAQSSGLPCLISDRITREVDVTGNVRFLPVDQGAELWVKEILSAGRYDRQDASKQAIKRICMSGFDISAATEQLASCYRTAEEK